MISRRRNLFVILLMAGLLLASLVVIATKQTRLGLDLKGGVELVYQGEPTPQTQGHARGGRPRRSTSCASASTSSASRSPRSSASAATRSPSGCPASRTCARAKKQVGTTAQLFFYDWEKNVIGNPQTPLPSLYDAVKKASLRKPEIDANNTTGTQYYLFRKRDRALTEGPDSSRKDLLSQFDGRVPPGNEIVTVPAGTVVVRAEKPASWPANRPFDRYFILRDNPELKGTDIKNPEQQYDNGGRRLGTPIVTFKFTNEGPQRLPRRDPAPGAARPDHAGAGPAGRELVPDLRDRPRPGSRPARTSTIAENPDGIDGRTGAQISGGFSLQEAQDLAERPEDRARCRSR